MKHTVRHMIAKVALVGVLIGTAAGATTVEATSTTVAPVAAHAPIQPSAASALAPKPAAVIISSGPWYKKDYTIFLNRSETWLLANSPSTLIDRLPIPAVAKVVLRGYVWLLQRVARSSYSAGSCTLLSTVVYAGWASPPGAATYRDNNCR